MTENRTPAQIEAELLKLREELTGTVDELSAVLSPSHQAAKAKDFAKEAVSKAQQRGEEVIAKASGGDFRAIAVIGAVAVGTLVLGGLVARKLLK